MALLGFIFEQKAKTIGGKTQTITTKVSAEFAVS